MLPRYQSIAVLYIGRGNKLLPRRRVVHPDLADLTSLIVADLTSLIVADLTSLIVADLMTGLRPSVVLAHDGTSCLGDDLFVRRRLRPLRGNGRFAPHI